jgi:tetratricopeptide (TPR) repeat protein
MIRIHIKHQMVLCLLAILACLFLIPACRRQNADPIEALTATAAVHVANGEFTAAEAAYIAALEATDTERSAGIWLQLAELYRRWQRPADGLAALANATSANAASANATSAHAAPAAEDVQQLRLALFVADGQWAEAVATAEAVLAEAPTNAAAWQHLIEAHLALGACDAAREAAARAATGQHDPSPPLTELVILLRGDYDALARTSPTLAAGIVPCGDSCDIEMGLRLVRQQRWALAACLLHRGLADDPLSGDVHWEAETRAWLGEAWMQLGRVSRARTELQMAVDLAPDAPLPWLLLGKSALVEGEFETAQDALYRTHQLDPLSPAPCLALAELAAAQGRYAEADLWIEAALERAPNEPDIYVAAARFYLKRDIASNVTLLGIVERALALAPEHPEVLVIVGWHRLNTGEVWAAREVLDQAVERAPELAEAHYLRGLALQATGAPEEATAALVRAADLGEERAQR